MKNSSILKYICLCLFMAFTGSVDAQKTKAVNVYSRAVEVNRGTDTSRVKSQAPVTDTAVAKPVGTCSMTLDNFSGYYLDIFVDGYYRGVIAPWGAATFWIYKTGTKVYCISRGGTREWETDGRCDGRPVRLNP